MLPFQPKLQMCRQRLPAVHDCSVQVHCRVCAYLYWMISAADNYSEGVALASGGVCPAALGACVKVGGVLYGGGPDCG